MMTVSTIAPEVPFVDALAAGLLADAGSEPLALADALILLPTRRACRSLRDAFLRQSDGRALILPQIQPLGEIDPGELRLGRALDLEMPPAIGTLRRQFLLGQLLTRLDWPIERALRLATDLAGLLDELQTEQIPLTALDHLVPEHLAEHWQHNHRILRILAEHWPKILDANGCLDPAGRRHRLLTAIAEGWRTVPPAERIVAAGSTGSISATRTLLGTIAALPRGEVVLPGLDREMEEASWQQLEPSHPQYGLKQLLDALGVERRAVGLWAAQDGDPARQRLLRETMRPAATIGAAGARTSLPPAAVRGLTIDEHPDLASEARAIALRMRATLEHPERTVALITPDRHLARRVAVELRRWEIVIDDSAGTPLDQTIPGSFLLLTARLIVEGTTPVALLATLKHPLARAGATPATFRRQARALERACLRGPRIVGGFPHLLDELNDRRRLAKDPALAAHLESLRDWLAELTALAQPFVQQVEQPAVKLADLIAAHLAFTEALATDESGSPAALWTQEAGEAAAGLLAELLEMGQDEQRIAPGAYPAILALLMAERPVRPRIPKHPRLFIWGQLEARLQHTDLMLLGGLNEGVWPGAVDPGPWLNRTMRRDLGLPAIERRIGLAAHDFVQAASAQEVVLSRAEKDAHGNPTVPSRWLIRLGTVLDATGQRDLTAPEASWRTWSDRLDHFDGVPRAVDQPQPKPPLAARPRHLSVSDIGTWMGDPYALYAKRILQLKPLDALEADPGALERGIIIHRVLERFVAAFPDLLPEDAEQRLLDLGRRAFAQFRHRPQVGAIWWPRFERIAHWVIEQERVRRSDLLEVCGEIRGELELPAPAGSFHLKARADRIERHPDGRLGVVDYKTGALPKVDEVIAGLAPQLPLEALMVQRGAFEGLTASAVADLRFWRLKGDEVGGEQRSAAARPPEELAAGALDGLTRLIAHYDREATGYPARYRPPTARARDYDHLARIGEWPK